ncbi:MAG: feruloyl-CoA synthase [Pseudomonadales bacterium]
MRPESSEPLFLTPDIRFVETEEGAIYLSSNQPLGTLPPSILTYLESWAQQRPDTVFLAERNPFDPSRWDCITYAQTLQRVSQLAQALSGTELSAERPLMIVSGNSISSGLMTLACMMIGVPVAPISPSYSLLSKDFSKVKHIQQLITPGLVFAENFQAFKPVLELLQGMGTPVITADSALSGNGVLNLARLIASQEGAEFLPRAATINPDTLAKILFTSGSTGMPKGVMNTHRMLVSNQEAIAKIWPFVQQPGQVFLDWLPWHHTFGGNHNFNMALRNGGSLYIDGGKPTSEGIKTTLRNMADISPTLYFNVAAGYELLVSELEQDDVLAVKFFSQLKLLFFAAAALPNSTWNRLQALIDKYASCEIPITSSWGATETSPLCTSVYFSNQLARNIGLPVPGTDVKLAPVGDLIELRVKGPNIMPGYFQNEAQTKEVFDEEGYFCSGDAVELIDRNNPMLGLMFKGRVNENFKLLTGTWVNVGELRVAVVEALSPLATDVVICGHNEYYLAVLIFPNVAECEKLIGGAGGSSLILNQKLQAEIIARLTAHNLKNSGSSKQIRKALLLASPPSFDDNEITDKGYLNQRGVLTHRAEDVMKLYAANCAEEIISI